MAKKRIKTRLKKRPKNKPTLHQVPGTVAYVGHKAYETTKVEIIDYSKNFYKHISSEEVEDAFKIRETDQVTWININGLNNTTEIEKLANYFRLHPLIQEDIVNTNQRPKVENEKDYLFVVFKMLYFDENNQFTSEHMSLVLGDHFVLTFQEAEGDVFDELRERIRNAKGRVREQGSDYLMFCILDAVVDNYFIVMEQVSEKIEATEDILFMEKHEESIVQDIQNLKREILRVRRAISPFREVMGRMEKIEHPYIEKETQNYIRDLNDHVVQVSESLEIYREMIWGLMEMYMTTINNKMNEIMKTLTIIASIFIPLTFVAGVYGMNFENMPELQWKNGYFYTLALMFAIAIGLTIYFRRKKWI